MEALLPALILLACPVGMGLMMFFMARGNRSRPADRASIAQPPSPSAEHPVSLEVLREEHRRLGEEIGRLQGASGNRHESAERR